MTRRRSPLARRLVAASIALLAVAIFLTVTAGIGAATATPPDDPANETVAVVVTFTDHDTRDAALVRRVGGHVTGGQDINVVPVLFATVPESSLAELRRAPGVASVERDRRVRLAGLDWGDEPADPRTFGTTGGKTASHRADASLQVAGNESSWGYERIDAAAALATVPESEQSAVDVAVIDTGVDTDHPQLADSLAWGLNTTGENVTYGLSTAEDEVGHGTFTTGVIAAADDGTAPVGVAPGVDVYAVKVFDGRFGTISDVVQGIDAVLPGPDGELGTADDPDVISMSLGGGFSTEAERRAIENASSVAVLVAAAGNSGDGDPLTDDVGYPAAYDPVIAVGATNRGGVSPQFSSDGPRVEVAAPGVNVTSTAIGGETTAATGTSVSAPFVAGTAALVIAEDLADGERDLSDAAVRERLQNATVDLGPDGRDRFTGFGELRVDAAVTGDPVDTPLDVTIDAPTQNETVSNTTEIVASVTDADDDRPTVEVSIDGGPWRAMEYDRDRNAYVVEWDSAGVFDGRYTIRVRARENGVSVRDSVTAVVDRNGARPAVQIRDPVAGEVVEGTVSVWVRAADGQTPAENLTVEVSFAGGPWRAIDYYGDGDFVGEVDVGLAPGNYTLRARATDGDGKTTTTSVPVQVDGNDPPQIAIYAPAEGDRVAGAFTVIADPVDDRTPTEDLAVEYRIDGGEWQAMTYNPFYDDFDANESVFGLADGPHIATFRASDGNLSSRRTVTFQVDNSRLRSFDLAVDAEGAAVEPGENATIAVSVDLAARASYLQTHVNGLPDGWEVTDVESGSGTWLADSRVLFWTSGLERGRTVSSTITVSVPENATASETLTLVAVTGDGRAEGTTAAVTVGGQDVNPVIRAIVGADGEVQAGEVLTAIDYYNTGEPVPGTGGETVSSQQVLEIIRRYNEQGE